MKAISADIMAKFVKAAGRELSGDWVIIGGAVLPLLGLTQRVTVDIDIAGPEQATQADILKLMGIAESLNIPIEAINQAGAFFLHKMRGWKGSLVEVHRGPNARIFRPNVELFILLKIARLTETDLHDCLRFLAFARKTSEAFDPSKLLSALKKSAKHASQERRERLRQLEKEVQATLKLPS